jgi:hypothetical protein
MVKIQPINESKAIELYTKDKMTLRMIADELNTNHHRVKRILTKEGIEITQKGRIRRPFTDEHRKKISESSKGRPGYWKGKTMDKISVLKNMVTHLQYDVTINDLTSYENIEKLKVLNWMLSKHRVSKHFNTSKYILFIDKFYNDPQFNTIYQKWLDNDKDKWGKPSLDHIQPLSKGGTWELNNLQILTWFENRAKCDMTQEEWESFKDETQTNSLYFI